MIESYSPDVNEGAEIYVQMVRGLAVSASGPVADRLYTTAQVADRLQLPVTTVRGAIRDGRLRAFLPAGRRHGYRIAESSIQAWLHASEYGAHQNGDR